MDHDHDMGNDSDFVPVSPSQLPPNQWHSREPDADLVKWQGSQTGSTALNALMKEAAKPIRRSPRNHRTQPTWFEPMPDPSFSGSSGTSSASTSGSNSVFISKPRVTRPRSRHLSAHIGSTSFLASTPTSSISTDPTQFLQTLKGVSEKVKVGESARAKKRLFSGEVKGLGSTFTTTRHGKPKENLRRSTTGAKESDKGKTPTVGSRSLPMMNSGGVGYDETMEVDGSTSFYMEADMDIGLGPSDRQSHSPHDAYSIVSTANSGAQAKHDLPHSRSHMPPPPVPMSKIKPMPPPLDYPKLSQSTSNPLPLSSKPKLASPQRAPPPMNPHHQSRPLPPPYPSQNSSISRPPNSQLSSRPPVLGMRRSMTTYSALAPSQTLPEKRKGFKVPLAKPAVPLVRESVVPPPTPSYRHPRVEPSRVLPTPEPSPPDPPDVNGGRDGAAANTQYNSSSPDGDSSYGDMSFDMDALEEAMKKYD